MKKIAQFTNRYQLSKTLQFKLLPIGNTQENFDNRQLLAQDEERAKTYPLVKEYMDRYHKMFIDSVLSTLLLNDLDKYSELYYKCNKTDTDNKNLEKLEEKLRKQISDALKGDSRYKKMFKKEMITELLPGFLDDNEEKLVVEQFNSFTTYFSGFNKNRENMYSSDAKSTAISYRCINDNLPKFLDNIKSFEKVKVVLANDIEQLNSDFEGVLSVKVEDAFTMDYFSFCLSQTGIKLYNEIIGGYTFSDGRKVKGLNEYINLYNQTADRESRLPLMKPLYKQILSDAESLSFIPEKFDSDDEVLLAINEYYTTHKSDIDNLRNLFSEFNQFDMKGIYISSGVAVTDISNAVFGNWSSISDGWKKSYENRYPLNNNRNAEKYYEKQAAAYKAMKSFSIEELQNYGTSDDKHIGDISEYFSETISTLVTQIEQQYEDSYTLLSEKYTSEKRLYKNEKAIDLIKGLLDSIKALERVIKPLLGTGKEEYKDNIFYSRFLTCYEGVSAIDKLYDRVRNYMTQKPYSKDKIKLNFENPQFMGGWDRNKEKDYRAVLLKKNNNFYLAVMDRGSNSVFVDFPYSEGESFYEKIEYKLLPGPNKMLPKVFFATSNIDFFAPSDKIMQIYRNETFKKGTKFNIDDCHALIDFYKESIEKHADWSKFEFSFKPTNDYPDIGAFYNDVREQGYSINTKHISEAYINELNEAGQIYLFQIYNKDFSEYSKGTPNLHTMYFKMLFDERNLSDVVYQLNGGAEMFFRKASIAENEVIKHPANIAVKNKNPDNPKKESKFGYDLIKDRRFTKHQFSLHLPITLNFKADGNNILNYDVRKALRISEENYIIGIDRGERNLLYICVINGNGEIVEQISLNEIINNYRNEKDEEVILKTDYHSLLLTKEKQRDEARKSWTAIENIKELKEGYLSQVIHKICQLVVKYDAVIAMEDLNSGFKNSRVKVERQVYQKFEKMLITKLQYLVDKKLPVDETGGVLHAYQLTNKEPMKGRQNGIIFYVPAWLTSKIDPTTGFVDLIHPHYQSVDASKELISAFDSISYNSDEDMFEFAVDYSKFPKTSAAYKTKWTICTNGERIRSFRNKAKNNEWDTETVVLTDEFKKLFECYNINISSDMKNEILAKTEKEFFESFIRLFALTLQMRNSIPNNTEIDYLISPVRNSAGKFYDSREYEKLENPVLPANADANGAYNIARKAMWAIDVLKATDEDELSKANLYITNKDWLKMVQE